MIFTLAGASIILYSFINYKKSFIFYLAFKLLLVTNITLISIPGIPLLTLDMFMSLTYTVLFFIGKKQNNSDIMPFPYKNPLILITVTMVVSSVFSMAGFMSELSSLIGGLLQNVFLFWLMWRILKKKEDFFLLFKLFTVLFFCSCLYGFWEYLIQSNPIVQYEATLNKDASKVIHWTYSTTFRGYRVQSFFEHTIGAGINWSMYCIFILVIYVNNKMNVPYKKLAQLTALLCVPCIILTKMRGPIVFFLIALLSIANFKKKKFYYLILIMAVTIAVLWPVFSENANIILSLVDSSAQKEISGSTLSQRTNQFTAAFELLKMSPVWGLGSKFANVYYDKNVHNLLGGESIWLTIITNYGIMGLISYILMAYYSIIKIPKKFDSKAMAFIALAYWVTNSVTSVPGMHMYMYYLIMIYFMKTSQYYSSLSKRLQTPQKA